MRPAPVIAALLLLAASAAAWPQDGPRESPGIAIADAAAGQIGVTLHYDPAYRKIDYPGGDVPAESGVCSDVVIRALRKIGVDLQVALHQDMKRNFNAYPKLWRLDRPDPNIDHRRVPNLMAYFRRQGKALPEASAFEPGDIVAWRLPNNLHHIGVVSDLRAPDQPHFLVVHNIGRGAQLEDILHAFPRIGHYRW